MKFEGKVAIVTGASAGIGRAYCQALAAEGATVVAAARSVGSLDAEAPSRFSLAETVRSGAGLPGKIYAQVCDLEVEDDVARLMDQTVANFGRLDVLVNNAGIYPHYETFKIDVETWEQSMRVNARGPFLTIKHAAPHMIRQGSGSIVNLTSGSAGFTPKGHAGHEDLFLYAVSKAALNRLTTFIAEELKPFGIAVNALSPGGVDTETWATTDPAAVAEWKTRGMVKPCTPEAVGPAMLYLAQQTAEGITGQILHTDEFRKSWPSEG
jgi:NAD(P)-dependent dehydrogenase (short-subunit alcohol dehydrogenase family)